MSRRLLRPRRWTPPAAPPDSGGSPLAVTRRIPVGGHGPEDVVFDDRGRVVTATQDGQVLAVHPTTGERTVLGSTRGRPLGVEPCPDGSVLVCDHDRGLLLVRPDGEVPVLVDRVDGARLHFASNVVRAADGTVWFTTSTDRWHVDEHVGDVLEHSGTGRLVRRDPDGTITTVLRGLQFANGLVLAPDGSCLLLAETTGYRISRHWLTGPRAGTTEPLVENLPESVRPRAAHVAWVMAFDLDGRPVHDLRLTDGSYGFVTGVAERDGMLVLASLHEDDLVVAAVPSR